MRRGLRDTLILAGAPTALALAVLLLGGTLARTVPADTEAALTPDPLWPASDCYTTTIVAVRNAGVAGGALLCLAADAIRPALYATGLTPGGLYSVWLTSFDRPSDRSPDSLVGDDLFSPDRPDLFGRRGGGVAPFDGAVHVQGHVSDRHLASGSQVVLVLVDDGVAGVPETRLGLVVGYARFRLP